jgi:hypothetical protein
MALRGDIGSQVTLKAFKASQLPVIFRGCQTYHQMRSRSFRGLSEDYRGDNND